MVEFCDPAIRWANGPLNEGGRMQWAEEEMIIIPGWVYRLLGWTWLGLRLVYTKPLKGQHTEY